MRILCAWALLGLLLCMLSAAPALAGGNGNAPAIADAAAQAERAANELRETAAGEAASPEAVPYETVPPYEAPGFPTDAVAAPQSVDGTVPLFRQASEDSDVLMEYYSGARLTALRPAGGGFWLVQAGVKGASIMGYMRADDLRFGTAAQREVNVCYMELRFNRETPVYAYCDTGAKVIGTCDTEHTYYAMSRTDGKWVQLFLPPLTHVWEQEDRQTSGFVYMETGLGRGYFHGLFEGNITDTSNWTVEPLPGEMTTDGAVDFAIDLLTSMPDDDPQHLSFMSESGASARFFMEDSLREMDVSVQLDHHLYADGDGIQWWHVFFSESPDRGVMWVRFRTGEDWRSYVDFIAPEEYEAYTIHFIL